MTEPTPAPSLPEIVGLRDALRRSLDASPHADAFTVPVNDVQVLIALLDTIHDRSGRISLVGPQGTLVLEDADRDALQSDPILQALLADVRLNAIAATIAEQAGHIGGGDALNDEWVRARLDDAVALAAGSGPTPPYVHRILDALLHDAEVLDLAGAHVPDDVRLRLDDAARSGAIRPLRT